MKVLELIKNFHREESGQDLVEYVLVLVAVGTGVAAASTTVSTDLENAVTNLGGKIATWTT
jgi:Flp pilus assembly pilin Flp